MAHQNECIEIHCVVHPTAQERSVLVVENSLHSFQSIPIVIICATIDSTFLIVTVWRGGWNKKDTLLRVREGRRHWRTDTQPTKHTDMTVIYRQKILPLVVLSYVGMSGVDVFGDLFCHALIIRQTVSSFARGRYCPNNIKVSWDNTESVGSESCKPWPIDENKCADGQSSNIDRTRTSSKTGRRRLWLWLEFFYKPQKMKCEVWKYSDLYYTYEILMTIVTKYSSNNNQQPVSVFEMKLR